MKSFLINPAILSIYKEGFEANTNGVSTGFIKWGDIANIKEVVVSISGSSGKSKETALAVYLKYSNDYERQQPTLVRLLMQLAKRSGKYKLLNSDGGVEENDLPILIPKAALGQEAENVKHLMTKLCGLNIK